MIPTGNSVIKPGGYVIIFFAVKSAVKEFEKHFKNAIKRLNAACPCCREFY